MKYLLIALNSCLLLSITATSAQEASKTAEPAQYKDDNFNRAEKPNPPSEVNVCASPKSPAYVASDERTEGPRDRSIFHTPKDYTLSHDTTGAMEFLIGHWSGKTKSGEIEESWTNATDNSIVGWRKITPTSGKIELQFIRLQSGKHGCKGFMRTFSDNLEDCHIATVYIKKATYGKHPSVLLSGDGDFKLSYYKKDLEAISLESNLLDEVQLKKL